MKVFPTTTKEVRRTALEVLIGASVATILANSSFEPPSPPPTHVKIHTPNSKNPAYVLPTHRYEDLTAIENTEAGTVKFVRWEGDKPRYDFNFNYNFVVTAEGDAMFDKGSKYMPPDLARDFDTVRTGFCERHKVLAAQQDHPMSRYCSAGPL